MRVDLTFEKEKKQWFLWPPRSPLSTKPSDSPVIIIYRPYISINGTLPPLHVLAQGFLSLLPLSITLRRPSEASQRGSHFFEAKQREEAREKGKMEVTRASSVVAAMLTLIFAIFSPAAMAQSAAPAPAPTSDGTAIDQGIAYALMLLALVLTYIIH